MKIIRPMNLVNLKFKIFFKKIFYFTSPSAVYASIGSSLLKWFICQINACRSLPAVQICTVEWGAQAIPFMNPLWFPKRARGLQGTRISKITT